MIRSQAALEQLTGLPIQATRHHRSRVHIQPNTRTIPDHWGLPHLWHYRPGRSCRQPTITCERGPSPNSHTVYTAGHLDFHASKRWPQLEEITITWRGGYGYVTAHLPDDEQLPLCRLRYLGSDTDWGFALYQASSDTYDDTLLPDGSPSGTPERALDCALGGWCQTRFLDENSSYGE